VRADRLVSILMLLQTRGQVTASEVAAELEISERTARRDLDALGQAGLPIYSVQGRGGGWKLLGTGKTDLSGLTAAEARALFRVAGPSRASPELKTALRKLVRALPEPFRAGAEAATTAVVVDQAGWGRRSWDRPPPPHLDAVQHAVVDGLQVTLGYMSRDGRSSERVAHPLGLVAKGSVWYLVADTEAGLRTFRVDRMTGVEPTGKPVVRPEGFNLNDAWRMISEDVDRLRTPIQARAVIDAAMVQVCRYILGTRVGIGPAQADGRVEIELRGHNVESLASEIAGFGRHMDVLEPEELRDQLRSIGEALVDRYPQPVPR
jgi:predicted DNA-binding transcriptional regulator YafY